MRIHNRSRVIAYRTTVIFIAVFAATFLFLNYRFVSANIQYVLVPSTITTKDSSADAARLFALSPTIKNEPLPNTATLVIDKLGVRVPIVFGTQNDVDLIYDALEGGVVHYSRTSKPGESGISIVLGHSSAYPWYKGDYGSVFALLSKLEIGDRFYVQYSDNRIFFYEMKENLIFNPFKSNERLTSLERASGNNIILISCYPVGTDYLRLAVRAEQIQP